MVLFFLIFFVAFVFDYNLNKKKSPSFDIFLKGSGWLKWISLMIFFICLLPMLCVKSLRASIRGNLIILTVFTIFKSLFVAFVASESKRPDLEQTACLVISYIFLGLAFLNHQTRRDVSIFTEITFIIVLYLSSTLTISFYSDTSISKLLYNSLWNTLLSIVSCKSC